MPRSFGKSESRKTAARFRRLAVAFERLREGPEFRCYDRTFAQCDSAPATRRDFRFARTLLYCLLSPHHFLAAAEAGRRPSRVHLARGGTR